MKRMTPWIALAIAASSSAGCKDDSDPIPPPPLVANRPESPPAAQKPRSAAPELGFSIENYPRVDGSTSTQPLMMMAACKILAAGYEWAHFESDDSRRVIASAAVEMMEGRSPDVALSERINRAVQSHGTDRAYVNLVKNDADLILVARRPSEDESKLAATSSVQLDVRPVALDAFVFLLNGKNPVSSLTVEQIRDIYSGRITSWKAVGGPDAPIRPYQRTRNSGSQELMRTLVMKDRAMIPAPDLLTGALMSSPFLAIDKDVHGIGYSVYYYHEFMAPRGDVKACAIDGVLPTSETIRARRYPFVTEVLAVIRRDMPAGAPARRLRDWLLEPAGQRVVEESGYVPIPETPSPERR